MFTTNTMTRKMRKAITIAAVCGRGNWFATRVVFNKTGVMEADGEDGGTAE